MELCSSTFPVNGSSVLEMGGDTAACGQPHLAAGRRVMPMKVYQGGHRKFRQLSSLKLSCCIDVKGSVRVDMKSSSGVFGVLKSFDNPEEALDFFLCVGQQPRCVHTTFSCNYMLEVLRVHGRVGEMVKVFELMQRQIIKRDLETYLIIF